MNEKPILFNPEMVRALPDGRKTQTRRVIKNQVKEIEIMACSDNAVFGMWPVDKNGKGIKCPYGKIGDQLWVKETFFAYGEWNEVSAGSNKFTFHRHHHQERPSIPYSVKFLDNPPDEIQTGRFPGIIGWYKKPSIFLERRDSRTDLEITDIRVERLQDISNTLGDIEAEGIVADKTLANYASHTQAKFVLLWDSINGKPRADGVDISWGANPWVWVPEFRIIK